MGPVSMVPPQQVAPNWRGGLKVRPRHLAMEQHPPPSAEPRKSGISEASKPGSPVVMILHDVLLPWPPLEAPFERLRRERRNLPFGHVQRKYRLFLL